MKYLFYRMTYYFYLKRPHEFLSCLLIGVLAAFSMGISFWLPFALMLLVYIFSFRTKPLIVKENEDAFHEPFVMTMWLTTTCIFILVVVSVYYNLEIWSVIPIPEAIYKYAIHYPLLGEVLAQDEFMGVELIYKYFSAANIISLCVGCFTLAAWFLLHNTEVSWQQGSVWLGIRRIIGGLFLFVLSCFFALLVVLPIHFEGNIGIIKTFIVQFIFIQMIFTSEMAILAGTTSLLHRLASWSKELC